MKKWTLYKSFLLTLALSIGLVSQSFAQMRIVIDGGNTQGRSIAVSPFAWQGSEAQDVAEIIRNDLNNSGLFKAMLPQNMPELPRDAKSLQLSLWSSLGVGNVIVGQVLPNGNDYAIAYQVVDTLGVTGQAGKVILQKQYAVPKNKLREGMHKISDDIFESLTGIRGAFRTKIAYVVQKNAGDKPYQLHIADYDGHNQQMIFQSREPLMSPAWSPNGRQLAYVSFENQRTQLIIQDIFSGKRQVAVAMAGHNGAPSFSPDGRSLAFSSSRDGQLNIYVLDLATKNIQQLTRNAHNNTEPSWSKDGESIIFTSDRQGNPQIYRMAKDGSNPYPLTQTGRNYSGKLMADGRTLVMIQNDHLMTVDLNSGSSEILTSTYLDETPSLSPNDLMIIYSSTQGLGKVLQSVSVDGHFKARLPSSDGQVKYPAWSPYLHQR